jgi:hypothetical protein
MEEKQKLLKIFSHLMFYIFHQETICELFSKIKINLIFQVIVVSSAL